MLVAHNSKCLEQTVVQLSYKSIFLMDCIPLCRWIVEERKFTWTQLYLDCMHILKNKVVIEFSLMCSQNGNLSCPTFYASGNTEFSFTACSLLLQRWLCFMWQDPEFKPKNLYKNDLLRASVFVTFLVKLTWRSVWEKIAISSSFGPFKEQEWQFNLH